MRSLAPAVTSALAARELVERKFYWFTARNRDTGLPESAGFWNDLGDISAPVLDALTGAQIVRDFAGSGQVVADPDVPLTADISVREIEIELSHITPEVELIFRGYDLRAAPFEHYRGLFDPVTRALVAPAVPRFVGFVNTARVRTPAEGGSGSVVLACVSHTIELTRSNSETRSDASQQARWPGDRFYRYTDVAHEWDIFWGTASGKVKTQPPRKGFFARLFG